MTAQKKAEEDSRAHEKVVADMQAAPAYQQPPFHVVRMSLVTLDHARVSGVAQFPGVHSLNMLRGVAASLGYRACCARERNVCGDFQVFSGPRAAAAAECRLGCYGEQVAC
jgi:hypothetical protein